MMRLLGEILVRWIDLDQLRSFLAGIGQIGLQPIIVALVHN